MNDFLFKVIRSQIFFALLFSFQSVTANGSEYFSGEFDLLEYLVVEVPGLDSPIHCTEDEIKSGLLRHIWLGSGKAPGDRLEASYYPLERKASWLVSNDHCKSQKPFYNGIGFDFFDQKTGEAVVYLAGFNKQPVDENEWRQSQSGVERMVLMFKPNFEVINVHKYDAQCDFENGSLPVIGQRTWLGRSNILFCELADEQGFIRLRRR